MANEQALKLLLAPVGECPQIGVEKGRIAPDGVSCLVSPYGSRRYIKAIGGRLVSVLQVMVDGGGRALVANAYTDSGFRRQGHATRLMERVRRDFAAVQLSEDLSQDGAAWVVAVSGRASQAARFQDGFLSWFEGSRVLDEDGRPLLLFHGTRRNFDRFSPSAGGEYGVGIYLTPLRETAEMYAHRAAGLGEPRVLEVYALLRNPFMASSRESARALGVKALMARGHDGIVATPADGRRQYVVFDPARICMAQDAHLPDDELDVRRIAQRPE